MRKCGVEPAELMEAETPMTRTETLELLHESRVDLSKWSIRHHYGKGGVLLLWLCVPRGTDIMLGEIGPDQPEDQAHVQAYLTYSRSKPVGREASSGERFSPHEAISSWPLGSSRPS